MPGPMPYYLEKGPALSLIESFLNDGDDARVLDASRNSGRATASATAACSTPNRSTRNATTRREARRGGRTTSTDTGSGCPMRTGSPGKIGG